MPEPWIIAVLSFPLMFGLIAMSLPIGAVLMVVSIAGLMLTAGPTGTMSLMGTLPYYETAKWGLVVVPMFLLMGNFAVHSGVGDDAFNAAEVWLRRIRGGLAMTTTAAGAIFGFASGSSVASAVMFTKIALPQMSKHNYDNRLSCGTISAAGTLAQMIPPSGLMVVYAMLAEKVSLGKLLIAGILPGLLAAAAFIVVIYTWIKINPKIAPVRLDTSVSWHERMSKLKWLSWVIVIVAFVLGGIYFGIFTPTEAGAVGAFFTFVILLLRRGLKANLVYDAVVDAAGVTALVFFIIVGAIAFSRFLAVSGLVTIFSEFILKLPVPAVGVVVAILIVYLILGTFLDSIGMMALSLPIFLPVIDKLGVDGIWFGILVIMTCEIGMLTPPVGFVVFAVKGAAGDSVTLEQVFAGATPFFFGYLGVLAILIAFPQIVLVLPRMMG